MSNEQLVEMIQTQEDRNPYLEELYHQNEGLIKKIANKFLRYAEFDDLTQEGYLGLVRAAELYNKNEGVIFASFAYKVILQKMIRYIETNGSIIRIPSYQRERIFRYKQTLDAFREQYKRNPSVWELSVLLDLSKAQVKEIKRDATLLHTRSLSERAGEEDSEITLEDIVADDRDEIGDFIERETAEELSLLLWSLVDELEKDQSDILRTRYQKGLTLKECGVKLGIKYSQVRLIEAKALRKLREKDNRDKLRPFYEDHIISAAYQGTGLNTFLNTWTSSPERAVIREEELSEKKRSVNY